MVRRHPVLAVVALFIAMAACGKKEEPAKAATPFKVQSVDVARTLARTSAS